MQGAGAVFNLGTGREVWIGDLLELILDLAREFGVTQRPAVVTEAQRLRPEKSEVLRLISDNHAAREVLGWSPQVSLEDGLRHTMRWIADHPELYSPDMYAV
jgi:nucleoside-diphosphate-sugar epimerase